MKDTKYQGHTLSYPISIPIPMYSIRSTIPYMLVQSCLPTWMNKGSIIANMQPLDLYPIIQFVLVFIHSSSAA